MLVQKVLLRLLSGLVFNDKPEDVQKAIKIKDFIEVRMKETRNKLETRL